MTTLMNCNVAEAEIIKAKLGYWGVDAKIQWENEGAPRRSVSFLSEVSVLVEEQDLAKATAAMTRAL